MSLLAAAPEPPVARELHGLRVALLLDPGNPMPAPTFELPGVDLHLHLVALDAIEPSLPFLRRADILVVEVVPGGPAAVAGFARLIAAQPRPVIAAVREPTAADTRALMRAGALDVLPLPLDVDDLRQAIDAARRALAGRAAVNGARGRVISFLHGVGGAGATSLACQAGLLWAARHSTCLIDLDVQFGAAALYLDMPPTMGVLDLVEARDRLDSTLFEAVAARHASGLRLVAGPGEMVPLDVLSPASVTQILSLAAQLFEVVLVDLPAAWTSWSLAALSHSDAICLVTGLSVPGLRQARRQLDVIEANELAAPVKLVLNRVPRKLFRTIDMGDSEKVLRRKVDFTVANDYPLMSGAIDQGRPLAAIRARSSVERDLERLVTGLDALVAA